MYPDLVLGLSDHTPGHTTVLGAVTLGARMVEKHFTDDVTRAGPDHKFSMDPASWKAMVEATRELENALGTGVKVVEANEAQTVVVQRRAVRARTALLAGAVVAESQLEVLRPCPADAIAPYQLADVVGRTLRREVPAGEHLRWIDFE